MATPLVGSIDLSVLGGPSSISLDVDFGPTGVRGSRIFGLPADPRLISTPKPLEVINYDLGIVITPSAPDYLSVYQKIGASAEDWEAFAALYPNFYSVKENLVFNSSGTASFDIVVSSVFTIASYALDMFNVFYQINTTNPVATSMTKSLAQNGSAQVLTVTIKAAELVSSSWTPLIGEKAVDIFATVV